MTFLNFDLLFLSYNITRMPLYIIILCNIFIAILRAPLVLYLTVSGKSKSIIQNIIEIAQHSLQVSLFTISGSA